MVSELVYQCRRSKSADQKDLELSRKKEVKVLCKQQTDFPRDCAFQARRVRSARKYFSESQKSHCHTCKCANSYTGILLQQLENIHLIVNIYLTIYLLLSTKNTEYIMLQPTQI